MELLHGKKMNSFQVIVFGFAGLILVGALILMLPIASRDGKSAGILTALFTSTSAVCVTGLVVRDTATGWSTFGQAVILTLIQAGGMGVVLIASAIAMLAGRKISLMQRSTMQDALSAPQVGGIVRLARFIFKVVFIAELVGMAVMAPVFIRDFGIAKGLWYAAFHSISAFCNAGFDLIGVRSPYSSLTSYSASPVILIAVMALIVSGGLGFLTWNDILANRGQIRKYRMQTKVILTATLILILVPAVYFFFGEFSNQPVGERILSSFFQAVTPRTAGFNSVDLTKMTDVGQSLLIMLMLTGGAPGSTAGGMKVTTVSILIMAVTAVWRRQRDTVCFGRRIEDDIVRNAVSVFLLYLILFLLGGFMISRIEGLPVLTCLFETASAIGTVGLTLGVTPTLSAASDLILILLMYFGRVGGLTLIFAALPAMSSGSSRFVPEKITVG